MRQPIDGCPQAGVCLLDDARFVVDRDDDLDA